jgi:hypothetical protein
VKPWLALAVVQQTFTDLLPITVFSNAGKKSAKASFLLPLASKTTTLKNVPEKLGDVKDFCKMGVFTG